MMCETYVDTIFCLNEQHVVHVHARNCEESEKSCTERAKTKKTKIKGSLKNFNFFLNSYFSTILLLCSLLFHYLFVFIICSCCFSSWMMNV